MLNTVYLDEHELPTCLEEAFVFGNDWTLLRLTDEAADLMVVYHDRPRGLRQCYYALRLLFWSEVFQTVGPWSDEDEANHQRYLTNIAGILRVIGPHNVESVRQSAQAWLIEDHVQI